MKKLFLILGVLALLAWPVHAQAAYVNHKSYTIKASQITGALANFTVDVAFTDTDLKSVGNGGFVTDAQGDDIEWFSNSNCSTGKLKSARIFWAAATGAFHFKVKIASAAVGSVIYQCFGDSGVTTNQNDPANTWDASTCSSWSFGDGTTLAVTDQFGSNNGTNHSATAGAGQVGGAIVMSGSTQYVDLGTGDTCITTGITDSNQMTINVLFKPTDRADYYFILAQTSSNIPAPFEYRADVTNGKPYFGNGNGFANRTFNGTSAPSTGSWSHLAITYTGANGVDAGGRRTHYLNGASNGQDTSAGSDFAGTGDHIYIGTRTDLFSYLKGSLDELRVDKIERSGDWEAAISNNQLSMTGFWDVGACSGCSGGGGGRPVGENMMVGFGK